MRCKIEIDREAAIAAGNSQYGPVVVDCEISLLSPELLEELATCPEDQGVTDVAGFLDQAGAPAERLILINPALDSNAAFPSLIGRIDVYYSPSDRPTWLAQWLPGNPWGAMGHTGYLGKDPRVTSHNLENILFRHVGHSDALHEPAFHNHLIGLFED